MSLPSPLAERLNRSQIPSLDGLRAVAVGLVIFYHLGFEHVPGGHGVTTFFVLSGFLITWLLLKEHARTGTVSLTGFFRRRALRIFPAFVVYWVLLVAALVATGRAVPWAHAWSALLYVSNYYNAVLGDPNTGFSHTWSLAIEEQFYLLWPFLFLVLVRNPARMAVRLVAITMAVWLYRAALVVAADVDQGYVYAAFDTRFDALMVGCLLAVLLQQQRFGRFWAAVTAHAAQPLLTIAVLVIAIFAGDWLGMERYRDVVAFALVPPLVALLITQLIALSGTAVWRWTESPVVAYLGRISYPLYLWQQLTVGMTADRFDGVPMALRVAGVLALTVLIASGSYYVVERPFLKLKARTHAPDAGKRADPVTA